MFERYTEKARRVIFFARYEASQYGSPVIDTEHLLLGILREDKRLTKILPTGAAESIRAQIDARTLVREKISTSIDLPLSNASKRVLAYGAEEAERLNHRHIGPEHLLLGLLREKGCLAGEILQSFGFGLEQLRKKFGEIPSVSSSNTIKIHDSLWNIEYVRAAVRRCREQQWHWDKRSWTTVDIVIEKKTGKVSFDLSLAADSGNFELVKGGWKKDRCFVCRWELFESKDDADHGSGYTNGHDWLCTECYSKFWNRPDFFSSSNSDVT
jgi:ATP-dependent Clp protease ATP-binding subunit ClpA